MKIQSLAIIFVIIILPISLVLSRYVETRVQTLSLQANYDSKLNDATYDALKAYQLNSLNSDMSDYTNSKMRDIKASVNTFFNSMSSSFGVLGYTKETLQNYIPALVYTMYDGYYIYSPYKNTWDSEIRITHQNDISYSDRENLYGLKPYVYYSCRYSNGINYDVTITYSLDNYIQIQGYVTDRTSGKKITVSKYGYLLGFKDTDIVNDEIVTYKGVEITEEKTLEENISYMDGTIFRTRTLKCKKINGTKYYADDSKVFSIVNGKAVLQSGMNISDITSNNSALKYYKEAYELKEFIMTYLSDLNTGDILYETNNPNYQYYSIGKIFDDWSNIENETSNFNTHRIDVIKNSIERNLAIVIKNFNNYSGVSTDFQMPKLKEDEWDKIINNISIISFMQGVNIGTKTYSGYSIITNTKNEDVVMPDSIYILTKDNNTFHGITEDKLGDNEESNMIGIFNINLERRSIEKTDGTTVYYFPAYGDRSTLSYGSIITQDNVKKSETQTLNDYIENCSKELKKVYYTALARERYGLYRQKLEI